MSKILPVQLARASGGASWHQANGDDNAGWTILHIAMPRNTALGGR